MKILIDTHILIWYLSEPNKLKSDSIEIINNKKNLIYFSSISIAEMAIKASLNNLEYPDNLLITLESAGFTELGFKSSHANYLKLLPFHHKDPFDRMLISQAMSEEVKVMSYDKVYSLYDIDLI